MSVDDKLVRRAAEAYTVAVKTDAFGDIREDQHLDAMQAALEAAQEVEGRRRDPLSETLARIGRDMAQQQRAADQHKRLGLADKHNYHEYHRFSQGRWGFYESARLIHQYFNLDFEAWLREWEPET